MMNKMCICLLKMANEALRLIMCARHSLYPWPQRFQTQVIITSYRINPGKINTTFEHCINVADILYVLMSNELLFENTIKSPTTPTRKYVNT